MFVVIDVETANADLSSICQIGVAKFDRDSYVGGWSSLVDPEDYFDGINIGIHGIDEEAVVGAPKYSEVANRICELLDDAIAVCHSSFDRLALSRASAKYSVVEPNCRWLDSARVARRTWVQFARRGYGLANLAQHVRYEFKHHDALNDAMAAGHVMLAAIRESGIAVEEWLTRSRQPIDGSADRSSKKGSISKERNPDGPHFGDSIVFTGALQTPRSEASALAARAGFEVGKGVTKKTTILVVGDQDIARLAGHNKSQKHRRAEELIEQGAPIRIVGESDFRGLIEIAG